MKLHAKTILAIIGLVVFVRTFFNGFVMDDQGLILQNFNVQSLSNLFNFFRGSIFDYGGSLGGIYYRPMMTTYFSIIYTFFGANAFFYHALQLAFHILTAILVFSLFKKFIKENYAFILSIVFLIHPIQVETVSYNAAIQDVLFVFFGLLFLNKLLDAQKGYWKLMPFAFLILSVFSKEAGFLFAPLGLLLIYMRQKKDLLLNFGMSFGVFIFYIIMRFGVARVMFHTTTEFPMMRMSFFERVLSIPEIILYYLKTFIFPLNLVSVQSWVVREINFPNFFFPLILITLLLSFGIFITSRFYKRKNIFGKLLFFWTFLVLGLLLHIQIVPLDLTVSDRWFYFPIIGLLGLIGVFFEIFNIENLLKKRKIFTAFLVIVLVILSFYAVRSFMRVGDWANSKVLAFSDLKIQKDNYQLLSTLGGMYLEEKNYTLAQKYSKASVEIFPHWGTSYYNLGVSYHLDKKVKLAEGAYQRSIKNAPANINAYENLAILYVYNYPPEKARSYSKESLKKFPTSAKLWHVLALSEQKLGNDAAATEAARMLQLLSKPSGI